MSALKYREEHMKVTTIGLYLRMWRESKGYSLRQLAAKFGKSNVLIVHIESEKFAYPVQLLKLYYPLMTAAERQAAKDILIEQLKQELE